jgi:hypothetical protein
MFVDMQDPQTYWLNVTNIGLGLATLAGLGLVAYAVGQEFLARSMQRRSSASGVDDHVFLGELGVTMADGGERTKKK